MSETEKPETPKAAAGRPGRGLRLALALSVAVNLAVAGLVVGMAWHGGPMGRGAMLRDMGFGPFEGALRPEDREALRGALRGRLGEIRQARQQMQEDIERILAALRAEPFDEAALAEAMAAQAANLNERLDFGSAMLRDHLLSLSAAERQGFADRMEHRLRGGPEGDAD